MEASLLENKIVEMKSQMEGEEEERQKFTRNAGDQQQRLEGVEAQVPNAPFPGKCTDQLKCSPALCHLALSPRYVPARRRLDSRLARR